MDRVRNRLAAAWFILGISIGGATGSFVPKPMMVAVPIFVVLAGIIIIVDTLKNPRGKC